MKNIRKFLASILVCLMFVVGSFTANTNILFAEEDEQEVINNNEVDDAQSNIDESEREIVDQIAESLGAGAKDEETWQKALGIYNLVKQAFGVFGGMDFENLKSKDVFGIIDLGIGILKYLGVIPNAEQQWHDYVKSRFNAIDNKLNDVSNQIDGVYNTMKEQYAQLNLSLTELTVDAKRKNLSSFYDNYSSKLLGYIETYNNGIRGQIKKFYESTSVGELKAENKRFFNYAGNFEFVVNIPVYGNNYGENQTIDYIDRTITINGETVVSLLNHYRSNHAWASDGQVVADFLKELANTIIINDLDDDNDAPINLDNCGTFATWLKYQHVTGDVGYKVQPWLDGNYTTDQLQDAYIGLSQSEKDAVLDNFVKSAYAFIMNQGMTNYACTDQGSPQAFISGLVTLFRNYCSYLSSSDFSIIRNEYDIFRQVYNFEGELNTTLEYPLIDKFGNDTGEKGTINSNLAELTKNNYIYELSNIGNFVVLMAKASGIYSDATESEKERLLNDVYYPWAQAADALEKEYKQFHTGSDNYCYKINDTVTLKTPLMKGTMYLHHTQWEAPIVWHDVYNYSHEQIYTYEMNNNQMVNNTDAQRIYATYKANYPNGFYNYPDAENNKDVTNFVEYLRILTLTPSTYVWNRHVPTLITKYIGCYSWGSESYSVHVDTCSKFGDVDSGYRFKTGSLTISGSDPDVKLSSKAVFETFDMRTGQSNGYDVLGAMATLEHNGTFKDDMGIAAWDKDGFGYSFDWGPDIAPADNKTDYIYDSKTYHERMFYSLAKGSTTNNLNSNNGGDVNGYISDEEELLGVALEFDKALAEKSSVYEPTLADDGSNIYDLPYEVYFDSDRNDKGEELESIEDIEAIYDVLISKVKPLAKEFDEFNNRLKDEDIIETQNINEFTDEDIEKLLIANAYDCTVANSYEELMTIVPINFNEESEYFGYTLDNRNVYQFIDSEWRQITKDEKISKDESRETIIDDDAKYFGKYDVIPSGKAKNFKLKYDIRFDKVIFNFYKEDGVVKYDSSTDVYEIKPILAWTEDGKEYSTELDNDDIKDLGIGKIKVRIPVYDDGNNRARVGHYYSKVTDVNETGEVLTGKIKTSDYGKYTEISVKSFSPFAVIDKYTENYIAPKTGI